MCPASGFALTVGPLEFPPESVAVGPFPGAFGGCDFPLRPFGLTFHRPPPAVGFGPCSGPFGSLDLALRPFAGTFGALTLTVRRLHLSVHPLRLLDTVPALQFHNTPRLKGERASDRQSGNDQQFHALWTIRAYPRLAARFFH